MNKNTHEFISVNSLRQERKPVPLCPHTPCQIGLKKNSSWLFQSRQFHAIGNLCSLLYCNNSGVLSKIIVYGD